MINYSPIIVQYIHQNHSISNTFLWSRGKQRRRSSESKPWIPNGWHHMFPMTLIISVSPYFRKQNIRVCPKMIQNGGDLRQNSGYPKIAIFKYSSRENDEKLSDFGIPHFRMIGVPIPGPLQIYLGCENGVICRWSATFRRTTWWPSLDNFLPNRFCQELGFTMENHHLN